MRHDKTPFIRMAKADGSFADVIGNKLMGPNGWITPKGGTHVRYGEGWLTYYEDLNADVQVYVESSQVRAVVKTTGNDQYHQTGVYRLDGKAITAALLIRATGYFTDGTADYLPIQGTLTCDGTAQTFTAKAPAGKTCYRLDVQSTDLTPDGMANYAYRQADITLTNHGWTLEAHAYVGPAGALNKAQATVSKTNPKYGEQIIFQAIETHPDEWRFSHWGTDVTNKDNPLYVTATPETVEQTAMFADASKVVNLSLLLYVNDSGKVCIESRTLQNRHATQVATVTLDLCYTDTSGIGRTQTGYMFEVPLNGQEKIVTADGTSNAREVDMPQNVRITLSAEWLEGRTDIETDNTRYAIEVTSADTNKGTAQANPSQVRRNGSSTITASPKAGYLFDRWEVHSPAETTFTLSKIRSGYTDKAWFKVRTYTMRAQVASGQGNYGTATVTPASVSTGGSATWTATPKSGYKFVRWNFTDGTSYTNASVVKSGIASDLTGTATFAVSTVTVDVYGDLGMDGETMRYRINVTLIPDVSGQVPVWVNGTLYFSDGDSEAFSGQINQEGQYYITTNILYREGRPVVRGTMQAQINTSGYQVGRVSYNFAD